MLLTLLLTAVPEFQLTEGTQRLVLAGRCDQLTAASKVVEVRKLDSQWLLEGVSAGSTTLRCVRGKAATVHSVVVKKAVTLREVGHAFRCLAEAPMAVVRHGRAELLDVSRFPKGLSDALLSELSSPGVVSRQWVGGGPPPRDELVRRLATDIEAWPSNTDHLTIALDEGGSEVQVLGKALNEDEVKRLEALAQRYPSVAFDVRLFDAASCK